MDTGSGVVLRAILDPSHQVYQILRGLGFYLIVRDLANLVQHRHLQLLLEVFIRLALQVSGRCMVMCPEEDLAGFAEWDPSLKEAMEEESELAAST